MSRLSPRPWENHALSSGHLPWSADYPHARGRTWDPTSATWRYRPTIPTPVGEPCLSLPAVRRVSDYPHARGRARGASAFVDALRRLSPRPWESRNAIQVARPPVPTIPTHVGEPRRPSRATRHPPDYPHARGRTESGVGLFWATDRLSPRSWENPVTVAHPGALPPTIPAPVGEPPGTAPHPGPAPDYPHACGRTELSDLPSEAEYRLSPRPWENPQLLADPLDGRPAIPTPVGEPDLEAAFERVDADYPHARGRALWVVGFRSKMARLSPRPWETRQPARSLDVGDPDYPHARGRTSS